jgi:RND family efflux transporter MFP subunit
MNRTSLSLLALAALACCLQAGCGSSSDAKGRRVTNASAQPAPAAVRPPVVNVIEAHPTAAPAELLVPAALSIENTALVLAQREGTLVQVAAEEGQRVAQGQLLARLNDDDQRAQLRQAELDVRRLQIEEQQYKALINVNRSELSRQQQLAKEGLVSHADVERAEYQLDVSTSEYEKTRLGTQTAQAKVEAVKLEIAKSQVIAPRAGVITRRYVSQGTGVVRGDKLFELAQLTPLTVKFQVPQTGAARLSAGQVVRLSLADGRGGAQARVRRIDPVADAASSTIGYLADVLGGAGLSPGLSVNVHVPRAAGGDSLWLPRTVFLPGSDPRPGASCTLFVVAGDRCEARDVWINSVSGEQVEINSGLAAGERVILAPPAGLKAGDLVQVE